MGVSFLRGQQLGRQDLNIYLANSGGNPVNAAEITYALYDFTTGAEALLGSGERIPANPSTGEYYASVVIPLDALVGKYRIRWKIRELVNSPVRTVLQEFVVVDRETMMALTMSETMTALVRTFRMVLRDNKPDRNYHFRPPTHEETIGQYNRVFGFIWEDEELAEFLGLGLDDISSAPPLTPFNGVDDFMRRSPVGRAALMSAASVWALQAVQINWIADEFDYSIGGVSLNIDKASKYESARNNARQTFEVQLDKFKSTFKYIKGLQQPKYGTGIRSAFGPYVGAGILSPQKFVGF